jgi:hypothetical protein
VPEETQGGSRVSRKRLPPSAASSPRAERHAYRPSCGILGLQWATLGKALDLARRVIFASIMLTREVRA